MLEGPEMLRAGLYVGLGSLGRDAANCVSSGSLGGGGGIYDGWAGIALGPTSRLVEL